MPTKAYSKFLKNIETVDRLIETYDLIRTQRNSRGRAAFDHVTRSAIIFLASAFEVYIEDVIKECCDQNITFAQDANKLPHSAKSFIGEYVKNEHNKVSPMELCDEGWRKVYRKICHDKTDKLNTPKKIHILDMFTKLIGLSKDDINNITGIDILDDFISFRGDIAHRCKANQYVSIEKVNAEKDNIEKITISIDKKILAFFRNTYSSKRLPWNDTY